MKVQGSAITKSKWSRHFCTWKVRKARKIKGLRTSWFKSGNVLVKFFRAGFKFHLFNDVIGG